MEKKAWKQYAQLQIVAAAMFFMLPAVVFAWPVPDTDQSSCFGATDYITCPTPGAAFYGQDDQYDINVTSYSVNADFSAIPSGVVRDNITGLYWQQATAPGTYTWQGAIDYCAALSLGGITWRLPSAKDLGSLIFPYIYPDTLLAINPLYFPNTLGDNGYWTITPYPVTLSNSAYYVNFDYGAISSEAKSSLNYVRCVSGTTFANDFQTPVSGKVYDKFTGLEWQQTPDTTKYDWQGALAHCENLNLGGQTDWRLPNTKELQSIVDYTKANAPRINSGYFTSVPTGIYWSSTTRYDGTYSPPHPELATALAVSLANTTYNVDAYSKTTTYYTLCVRDGQCGHWGDTDGDGICDDGDVSTVVGDNTCIGDMSQYTTLDTVFCDDNCVQQSNKEQYEYDSDGIGNLCDVCPTVYDPLNDIDGDGKCGSQDNCPTVYNPNQANADGDAYGDACDTDADNDGIPNGVDNCPLVSNLDQLNTDGDAYGNACDPDDDNDGILDGVDNCPLVSNLDQFNTDGDAYGDACDTDDDNDGIPDGADNCPTVSNPDQADNDLDGIGDVCESDDDNDGIPDGVDNCPTVSNPDQADADGDGIGNVCDPTLIELQSFTATAYHAAAILTWQTAAEIDTTGFNILRSEAADGQYVQINDALIPAQGSATEGAAYKFIDKGLQNRQTYYFQLEDVDNKGVKTTHGPVSASPRWFWLFFRNIK